MAKGHTRNFVKKQVNIRPETTIRELPPRLDQSGKDVALLCPFCTVPHPISVGRDTSCGTTLRVTAVQTILPARTVRKHELICVKCHKSGGEMIRFNNAYVHLIDCTPGTKLVAVPPKFSRAAQFVHSLPLPLRRVVERRVGFAKSVEEVDPEGKETGRTLGYFFYKQQVS
jgi:hypothetical protein